MRETKRERLHDLARVDPALEALEKVPASFESP